MKSGRYLLPALAALLGLLMPLAAAAATDNSHYSMADSANQGQMALSYGVALTGTLALRQANLALTDSLFFSTILTLGILTAKELGSDHSQTAGPHVANAIGVGANVLIASAIEF